MYVFIWGALVLLLVAAAALYCFTDRLLERFLHAPKPGALGLDYGPQFKILQTQADRWYSDNPEQMLYIRSDDGTRLAAHYWSRGADTTVLFVHGYGHSGRQAAFVAPLLEQFGCDILAVDCRAHGESEGKYIDLGWPDRLDVLRWAEYLTQRRGAEHRIILIGLSMGAAAVIAASGEALPPGVKGICADCGFGSLEDMFKSILKNTLHLPVQPCMFFLDIGFRRRFGCPISAVRPVDKLKKCTVPALFIHGERDSFVPCSMARQLYDACPTDKELLLVPGAGHALSAAEAPEEYLAALGRLFEKSRA